MADTLVEDADLFQRVVAELLENHFPPSLHADICTAVGLRTGLRLVGGPDSIDNALGLCALYHRALDRGVMAVSLEHRTVVSRRFNGGGQARELVIDLAGRSLHPPQAGLPPPAAEYLTWHEGAVFKGGAREPGAGALAAERPHPFRR